MTDQNTATDRVRFDTGAAALWASAFVVAAMLITQAARVGLEAEARAEVTEVGDLTVMTASAGADEDILAILDRRDEALFIYGVQNRRDVVLYQGEDLSQLFVQARARAGGR